MAMFDLVCWNNGTVSDQPRLFNVMFWKTTSCGWLNYIKFLFPPTFRKTKLLCWPTPSFIVRHLIENQKDLVAEVPFFPHEKMFTSYVHMFTTFPTSFKGCSPFFPYVFFHIFHHYSHIFRGVSPCFPAISKDFPHVSQQFQRISPMFPSNFKGFPPCFPAVSKDFPHVSQQFQRIFPMFPICFPIFPCFPSHFPFWRPLHHLRSK